MPFVLPAELSWPLLGVIAITVTFAYLLFGAIGFGSSILSVPVFAHFLPLTFVVPMITAIDCGAITTATLRQWRHVDWREFRRLLVPVLAGIAIGLTLLIRLPRGAALLALGVFVAGYAAYTLYGAREWRAIRPVWAIPLGIAGGVFSALFGTGGPIYMVYLSSRIGDKTALRATSSMVIGLSVVIRALAFVFSGMFLQQGLLLLVGFLLPLMLVGYALGSRLHARLSGAALRRWIAWLLLVNGIVLVARAVDVLY
jgi:uncharacterized membrane protein YfcA